MSRCLATLVLAFLCFSRPALSSTNGSNGEEGTAALGVDSAPPGEEALNPYRQSIHRLDPMDTTGLDYGLTNVLRRYYEKNFTDENTWEQIQSIRFEGVIQFPHGSLRFVAYKKKPDLCKVVLFAPNGGRIVMAYDGQDAWQLNTVQTAPRRSVETPLHGTQEPPVDEPPSVIIRHPSAIPHHPSFIRHPLAMARAEALNFIRDATTGGHLLYPLAEGKQIELIGTTIVEGERCYELKLTLPDGQVIRYMLDMTDYAERRQVTINNVSGDEEVNTHSDFRDIGGVRIPFTSTLTTNGQQVHQSRIITAETNVGAMPWMFTRPSGAQSPDESVDDPAVDSAKPAPSPDSVFQIAPKLFEGLTPED